MRLKDAVVDGGFTTSPQELVAAKGVAGGGSTSVSSQPAERVGASASVASVVTNSGYDAEQRQATQALDQALIVRCGLLLPNGTMEIDNTTTYFNSSQDRININGFALLPILVVGDIASQRVRKDLLLPTFTTRLGLPYRLQFETYIPYGSEVFRTVDANNVQTSESTFGFGNIAFRSFAPACVGTQEVARPGGQRTLQDDDGCRKLQSEQQPDRAGPGLLCAAGQPDRSQGE